MIDVKIYETEEGKSPFEDWLDGIGSVTAKSRILKALSRLETGLISDSRPVGKGVHEIKLHFEKGYRLYFGYDGDKLVILLTGSDKSDQKKAIKKAHQYWQDYKKRKTQTNQGSEESNNETRKRADSGGAKKK